MGRSRTVSARDSEALEVMGLEAPVEVRRHPAARRMTLRVSRTRRAVIVTLPTKCDLRDAGVFLNSHLDWVRRHLGTVPEPQPFADGALVPLRGEMHKLVFAGLRRGCRVVEQRRTVGQTPELVVSGLAEHAPRRLRDWMMDEARHDLAARVAVHVARLGLKPGRITVRDQTSRWGSCSVTGNLNFSWRLVLAPPVVLDYVAAHEVAHLREMNHGPRFWALVRKTMPEMDEAKAWLSACGLDLHRYG